MVQEDPALARQERILWRTGIADVLLFLLGVAAMYNYDIFGWKFTVGLGGLGFALGAIAINNFVGFYRLKGEIRTGLAAAALLFFLTLFASMLLGDVRDQFDDDTGRLMFSNLTGLVGTIVAFYFGAAAVDRAVTSRVGGSDKGALDAPSGAPAADEPKP